MDAGKTCAKCTQSCEPLLGKQCDKNFCCVEYIKAHFATIISEIYDRIENRKRLKEDSIDVDSIFEQEIHCGKKPFLNELQNGIKKFSAGEVSGNIEFSKDLHILRSPALHLKKISWKTYNPTWTDKDLGEKIRRRRYYLSPPPSVYHIPAHLLDPRIQKRYTYKTQVNEKMGRKRRRVPVSDKSSSPSKMSKKFVIPKPVCSLTDSSIDSTESNNLTEKLSASIEEFNYSSVNSSDTKNNNSATEFNDDITVSSIYSPGHDQSVIQVNNMTSNANRKEAAKNSEELCRKIHASNLSKSNETNLSTGMDATTVESITAEDSQGKQFIQYSGSCLKKQENIAMPESMNLGKIKNTISNSSDSPKEESENENNAVVSGSETNNFEENFDIRNPRDISQRIRSNSPSEKEPSLTETPNNNFRSRMKQNCKTSALTRKLKTQNSSISQGEITTQISPNSIQKKYSSHDEIKSNISLLNDHNPVSSNSNYPQELNTSTCLQKKITSFPENIEMLDYTDQSQQIPMNSSIESLKSPSKTINCDSKSKHKISGPIKQLESQKYSTENGRNTKQISEDNTKNIGKNSFPKKMENDRFPDGTKTDISLPCEQDMISSNSKHHHEIRTSDHLSEQSATSLLKNSEIQNSTCMEIFFNTSPKELKSSEPQNLNDISQPAKRQSGQLSEPIKEIGTEKCGAAHKQSTTKISEDSNEVIMKVNSSLPNGRKLSTLNPGHNYKLRTPRIISEKKTMENKEILNSMDLSHPISSNFSTGNIKSSVSDAPKSNSRAERKQNYKISAPTKKRKTKKDDTAHEQITVQISEGNTQNVKKNCSPDGIKTDISLSIERDVSSSISKDQHDSSISKHLPDRKTISFQKNIKMQNCSDSLHISYNFSSKKLKTSQPKDIDDKSESPEKQSGVISGPQKELDIQKCNRTQQQNTTNISEISIPKNKEKTVSSLSNRLNRFTPCSKITTNWMKMYELNILKCLSKQTAMSQPENNEMLNSTDSSQYILSQSSLENLKSFLSENHKSDSQPAKKQTDEISAPTEEIEIEKNGAAHQRNTEQISEDDTQKINKIDNLQEQSTIFSPVNFETQNSTTLFPGLSYNSSLDKTERSRRFKNFKSISHPVKRTYMRKLNTSEDISAPPERVNTEDKESTNLESYFKEPMTLRIARKIKVTHKEDSSASLLENNSHKHGDINSDYFNASSFRNYSPAAMNIRENTSITSSTVSEEMEPICSLKNVNDCDLRPDDSTDESTDDLRPDDSTDESPDNSTDESPDNSTDESPDDLRPDESPDDLRPDDSTDDLRPDDSTDDLRPDDSTDELFAKESSPENKDLHSKKGNNLLSSNVLVKPLETESETSTYASNDAENNPTDPLKTYLEKPSSVFQPGKCTNASFNNEVSENRSYKLLDQENLVCKPHHFLKPLGSKNMLLEKELSLGIPSVKTFLRNSQNVSNAGENCQLNKTSNSTTRYKLNSYTERPQNEANSDLAIVDESRTDSCVVSHEELENEPISESYLGLQRKVGCNSVTCTDQDTRLGTMTSENKNLEVNVTGTSNSALLNQPDYSQRWNTSDAGGVSDKGNVDLNSTITEKRIRTSRDEFDSNVHRAETFNTQTSVMSKTSQRCTGSNSLNLRVENNALNSEENTEMHRDFTVKNKTSYAFAVSYCHDNEMGPEISHDLMPVVAQSEQRASAGSIELGRNLTDSQMRKNDAEYVKESIPSRNEKSLQPHTNLKNKNQTLMPYSGPVLPRYSSTEKIANAGNIQSSCMDVTAQTTQFLSPRQSLIQLSRQNLKISNSNLIPSKEIALPEFTLLTNNANPDNIVSSCTDMTLPKSSVLSPRISSMHISGSDLEDRNQTSALRKGNVLPGFSTFKKPFRTANVALPSTDMATPQSLFFPPGNSSSHSNMITEEVMPLDLRNSGDHSKTSIEKSVNNNSDISTSDTSKNVFSRNLKNSVPDPNLHKGKETKMSELMNALGICTSSESGKTADIADSTPCTVSNTLLQDESAIDKNEPNAVLYTDICHGNKIDSPISSENEKQSIKAPTVKSNDFRRTELSDLDLRNVGIIIPEPTVINQTSEENRRGEMVNTKYRTNLYSDNQCVIPEDRMLTAPSLNLNPKGKTFAFKPFECSGQHMQTAHKFNDDISHSPIYRENAQNDVSYHTLSQEKCSNSLINQKNTEHLGILPVRSESQATTSEACNSMLRDGSVPFWNTLRATSCSNLPSKESVNYLHLSGHTDISNEQARNTQVPFNNYQNTSQSDRMRPRTEQRSRWSPRQNLHSKERNAIRNFSGDRNVTASGSRTINNTLGTQCFETISNEIRRDLALKSNDYSTNVETVPCNSNRDTEQLRLCNNSVNDKSGDNLLMGPVPSKPSGTVQRNNKQSSFCANPSISPRKPSGRKQKNSKSPAMSTSQTDSSSHLQSTVHNTSGNVSFPRIHSDKEESERPEIEILKEGPMVRRNDIGVSQFPMHSSRRTLLSAPNYLNPHDIERNGLPPMYPYGPYLVVSIGDTVPHPFPVTVDIPGPPQHGTNAALDISGNEIVPFNANQSDIYFVRRVENPPHEYRQPFYGRNTEYLNSYTFTPSYNEFIHPRRSQYAVFPHQAHPMTGRNAFSYGNFSNSPQNFNPLINPYTFDNEVPMLRRQAPFGEYSPNNRLIIASQFIPPYVNNGYVIPDSMSR